MRAREFINEVKTKRSKLKKAQSRTIPNLETWPELNNNNSPYLAFRYGVAMAGAPAGTMDPSGPIGGDFTTIGYTDADKEIMRAAAKTMGINAVAKSSSKSEEPKSTNSVSPVPDRKTLKK
jgi:hypothetical protein